jgi:PAS domain S-box-containing protein
MLSKKLVPQTYGNTLKDQAFNNSLLPNILSTIGPSKILMANHAACKLFGYSKKNMISKTTYSLFHIDKSSFKDLLKQRNREGQLIMNIPAIKKSGKVFPCQFSSAVFTDTDGIKRAISSIIDLSKSVATQKNIDISKEKIVANDILFAKSKQRNIDLKKEKIVADNIEHAKSKQKVIDDRKAKIVAVDIKLALEKSDSREKRNNEWIRSAGKISYDVMWDWNISSGEIYVGDSITEVFGYKVKNNHVQFKEFIRCLLPEEVKVLKERLIKVINSGKNSWHDTFHFKRLDGSVASATSRANIIRDLNGKATNLIGALQDLSNLVEKENALKDQYAIRQKERKGFLLAGKQSNVEIAVKNKLLTEFRENFKFVFNSSSDVLYDFDLKTGKIMISDNYESEFGYKIEKTMTPEKDWFSHVHQKDQKRITEEYLAVLKSDQIEWIAQTRFLRSDHSIANVWIRGLILRDNFGKLYRIIGCMKDISKQIVLEEKLQQEIQLREQQVAEAWSDAKSAERSEIGKELHDNVNQLLGASKLYIDMAKLGGNNSEMCLSRSSEYTLTAIEEIRKLTKGLTTDVIKNLGLEEAIKNICHDIMEVNAVKVSFSVENFKDESVDEKFKLNLFRIVQEQINNILKHAHATEVDIKLTQNKKSIILSISDNGIGFDTTLNKKGIGIANIKSRAATYKGTANFITSPAGGCVLRVTFPETDWSS